MHAIELFGSFNKLFGQFCGVQVMEQVGGMDQLGRLVMHDLGNLGLRVAKSSYGDAGTEINVLVVFKIP